MDLERKKKEKQLQKEIRKCDPIQSKKIRKTDLTSSITITAPSIKHFADMDTKTKQEFDNLLNGTKNSNQFVYSSDTKDDNDLDETTRHELEDLLNTATSDTTLNKT